MQLPKWMQSSADEQQLALTIKGLLTGIVPVLILFSNVRGWHLTESGLDTIIDTFLQLLSLMGVIASTMLTLVGLVRKTIISVKESKPPTPPTP